MPDWRPTRGCSTCRKIAEVEASLAEFKARSLEPMDEGKVERDHWLRILPALPDPYILRSFDGGVQIFRSGGRRGPGRRRRRR